MEDENKSFKSIFKATFIFGGTQIFQIFIQILRSKIVALLLGPTGIGIISLLNVTVNLIGSLTNFGLQTIGVQEIAEANSEYQGKSISETYILIKKLVWFTGILGMVISIGFSPLLSKITFGNYQYTYAFVWLSISLLFNQLTIGKLVILQGLRKLKLLAKANLFGSLSGLIIAFPLFYFFNKDGIVFSIISYSILTYFFAWYFTRTISFKHVNISNHNIFLKGKKILSLGFILGISGLVTLITNYLFSIFITKFGDFEQLGFYSAGIAITTNYTGLLFSAIAIDYHPRLASLTDNSLVKRVVNQQAEIGLIILTPLILTFIVFGDFFIKLLYSKSFLEIKPMICWILLGTFFKLFSWSISFTFVARGMVKLFFWNELAANIYVLFFSCFGFYFYGLNGIGVAFLISFLVYSVQVYFLARKQFNFSYDISFIKGFVFQFGMACIAYFGLERIESKYSYILGAFFIITSLLYSLWELDKKIQLKSFFKLNRF